MVNRDAVQKFQEFSSRIGLKCPPAFHVVLGSGFGAALDQLGSSASRWELLGQLAFPELPGLAASTVQDHAGTYRFYRHRESGFGVSFQLGRLHGYEGHLAPEVVQTVMIPRLAGVENFLLTNAAGGIDTAFQAGDTMLIRDHVNMTGQNPLIGENPLAPNGQPIGPRFPDLSQVYEPEWRKGLRTSLEAMGVRVHEGIYMGLLGPSFETPSEVQLYSRWGMQAVGMSTVWEAISLKHSGAKIAGLSLISNAACGLGDGAPLEHEKIVETCRASAKKIVEAVFNWLESELR